MVPCVKDNPLVQQKTISLDFGKRQLMGADWETSKFLN